MKISGFSFIRNAIRYDYPIVEAITSILPICDEFVIAVGNSDDDTLALIQAIDSDKIKIIETVWDDSLRENGAVLAQETDKAFQAVAQDSDWAFYIQGDEVLHEKYLDVVYQAMLRWKDEPKVDGLLFNYLHFYGSYDYVGDSRRWYRNEIRVVKNNKNIFSYKDAQGFRKLPNQKLNVKSIDASMYHYGWVKDIIKQREKHREFHKIWQDDIALEKTRLWVEKMDYTSLIDSLLKFEGKHPQVMQKRIEKMNWAFEYDTSLRKYSPKVRLLMWIERNIGWRIGEYKNYKVI